MNRKPTFEILHQKPGRQNPVNTFLADKRSGTRDTYQFCLNKVARKLGMLNAYSFTWWALRYKCVTMIAAWMNKDYLSKYAFKTMTAVRGVLRPAR